MKKQRTGLFLLGMLLLQGAGCGLIAGDASGMSGAAERLQAGAAQPGTDIAEQETEVVCTTLPQSAYEHFEDAYREFAVGLLKQNIEKGENVMVSPLSVISALAMTGNGAEGETLAQMEQVLYGAGDIGEMNVTLSDWQKGLPDTEDTHLSLANSIWMRNQEERLTVKDSFLQKNNMYYDAAAFLAPFDKSTVQDINAWVKKETEGMIPDILQEIPEEAVMYLVNAVAFEAKWQHTYQKNNVCERDFKAGDGTVQTASMMYSEEERYLEDAYATGFVKPYADGYSFVALLPKEGMAVQDYVEHLTAESFRDILQNAQDVTVNAGLPKFEATYCTELSDCLKEMGMPLAFDPEQADFSGIGTSATGNIYISRVLHKTYICVDELGTRAGAATAVEVATECALIETKIVILDHPFVYAIIENESGLPVFLGTVENVGK